MYFQKRPHNHTHTTHTPVWFAVHVTCVFRALWLWLTRCESLNRTRLRRGNKAVCWVRWRIGIKDDCNPLFKLSSGCTASPPHPHHRPVLRPAPLQQEAQLSLTMDSINVPRKTFQWLHTACSLSEGAGQLTMLALFKFRRWFKKKKERKITCGGTKPTIGGCICPAIHLPPSISDQFVRRPVWFLPSAELHGEGQAWTGKRNGVVFTSETAGEWWWETSCYRL